MRMTIFLTLTFCMALFTGCGSARTERAALTSPPSANAATATTASDLKAAEPPQMSSADDPMASCTNCHSPHRLPNISPTLASVRTGSSPGAIVCTNCHVPHEARSMGSKAKSSGNLSTGKSTELQGSRQVTLPFTNDRDQKRSREREHDDDDN